MGFPLPRNYAYQGKPIYLSTHPPIYPLIKQLEFMKKPKAIHSKQCWIDGAWQEASVFFQAGVITEIRIGALSPTEEVIDYGDAVIMPGAIDAHVHINEPGRTNWEGFETATKAAARGGLTSLVDMPLNSSPVVTNMSAFRKKIAACQGKLYVNCGFWAGATEASIAEVTELIEAGCLGVKVFLSHSGIDEFPNISLADLDTLMEGIQHLCVPILAHCELDTLPAANDLANNPRSYQAYLKSRPKLWENEAVKKFVSLSEKHDCKAHVVHLASDEVIDWIMAQKEKGTPFTVETCPHYIFFNADEIEDGNTLLKCAPPIRAKSNGAHLRQALKNGVIDFISSDHSPAPLDIKEVGSGNFAKAWGGIAGLQFLLSASWSALKEEMSLREFIPLLTSKPAEFLGLENRIGHLKVGHDADITIWEPEETFQVTKDIIEHKHKATPYLNRFLFGKVRSTIVRGVFAFQDGRVGEVPFGEVVKRVDEVDKVDEVDEASH